MSSEFLKYVINEDIYSISEPELEKSQPSASDSVVHEPASVENKPAEPIMESHSSEVIAVLVATANHEIDPSTKDYIDKILNSVRLSLSEAQLIAVSDAAILPKNLSSFQRIISFTGDLPLPFSSLGKYSFHEWEQSRIILLDPPEIISGSVEFRKRLWNALKQEFKIE